MQEYEGRVRLVIKNYPYKYRDYSHIAAEASLAAGDQGKYWEMHDMLLASSPRLDRTSLIQYGEDLGLDMNRYISDLDTMKHKELIERDKELAFSLDLYNTPTYFINGRKVIGNRPYAYLKKIIEEELQRAEH
jgi:protein-disulfide isomerase